MVDFEFPESMDDLLYFTNRKLPDGTRIIAWVERQTCAECGEADMGKPINEKTGKPKIRSSKYVCPECGHEEPKKQHEENCDIQIQYTNPEGTEKKTTTTKYKRRTWHGMKAFVFHNEFTDERFGITKRLKTRKEQKEKKRRKKKRKEAAKKRREAREDN